MSNELSEDRAKFHEMTAGTQDDWMIIVKNAMALKPFVSEQNLFLLENHGIFQGYYFFEYLGLDKNLRDRFRGIQATRTPRSSAIVTTRAPSTRRTTPCRSQHSRPW